MAGGVGSAAKVKAAERRRLALELRKAGISYRDIADAVRKQLGLARYSYVTAYRDVMQELYALQAACGEEAEKVREIELHRLDELTRLLWERVQAKELLAIDRYLRVMERRARLLGLDAPASMDVTSDGKPLQPVVMLHMPDDGRG